LRAEVESLLAADQGAADFMKLGVASTEVTPGAKIGDRIGRYKLLEMIGEGGFGIVYMAEQQEPVQRKVALKIIKAGMDTREVIARFEAERQALALMDHPNIAKVLDGGTTGAERPYFVMELVRGIPIIDYCDEKNLSTTERLQLFIKVCQAVQHAHQKAVIHRDLKPSNILVTLHDGEPVPKVIDFGVAKALGQKLTEKTLFTSFRQMIGTPAYMSPEQAEMSGLDIDTRSDIYSLGVLLYELLTGVTPFDKETLAKAAFDEIRRMIRENEPPKPSTRLRTLGDKLLGVATHRCTEPAVLRRLVRGDLDWIVMKCLEKDRTRRYETANGLTTDIRRFLNNEPVSAAAPSALYRAQKFAHRHRVGLTITIGFVLLLAAAAAVSTWEAVRIVRAERIQRQLLQRTQQAERDNKEKLWASYLAQAHARRWSGQPGRRFEALGAIARAAAMHPSLDLRNEAIACMALPDMRLSKEWHGWPPGTTMLAFDGPHERYARCNTNGGITIRRVADDQELQHFPGPGKPVWLMLFSPDGKFLVARYNSGYIQTWDVAHGEPMYKEPFAPFALSPDSRHLAVVEGASIRIRDLTSGSLLRFDLDFAAHDIAFDPSGLKLAAASSHPDAVCICDAGTGKTLLRLPHPSRVHEIAWHPNGNLLASACADSYAYVWNLNSPQKPIASLEGHQGEVTHVAFSHNNYIVATMSWDETVRLWDGLTGKLLVSDFGAPVIGFPHLQFSSDDHWLSFAAASGESVGLWETSTGLECRALHGSTESRKAAWCLDFSPDNRLLAAGYDEGVSFLDTSTGAEVAFLPIGYTRAALFDPRGDAFWTCRENAGVDKWPLNWDNTGSGMRFHIGPPETVQLPAGAKPEMLSIANETRTLAVADSAHAQVVVLDLAKPGTWKDVPGQRNIVDVSISPDGRWVATATGTWAESPGKIRVAEVETGKLIHQDEPTGSTTSTAFSPDGRFLATDHSSECWIWEVGTWKILRKFPKNRGGVVLAFSRDSRIFAYSQSPQSIKLLSVDRDWEEIASLDASEPIAYHPAGFSPDGGQFAVVSDNKRIRLWDLRSIRSQLASLGLDWDAPRLADSSKINEPIRAIIESHEHKSRPEAQGGRDFHSDLETSITPRDPNAGPYLIDLSRHFNAALDDTWHSGLKDNSLAHLPHGLQTFSGVNFDVRGIIQLAGLKFDFGRFPENIEGIRINLSCRRIHFLQATQWHLPDGTVIGRYTAHYADGRRVEIPIVYGTNIRDWWSHELEGPLPQDLSIAWSGWNVDSRSTWQAIRLFEWKWENPRPATAIETLDFESSMTDCSPFLIGITLEP
jgi:WD40 repeat protein